MNKIDTNFDNDFDKLLLRWFDGDLYGQELSNFEADPRFIEYQQIGDNTEEMVIPIVDLTESAEGSG